MKQVFACIHSGWFQAAHMMAVDTHLMAADTQLDTHLMAADTHLDTHLMAADTHLTAADTHRYW